jgi:hypothetical protein
MAFSWGGLGRGLLQAAPFLAAPFTGGASLLGTIGSVAGAAAPILGGLARGRAEGQQRDIGNQQNQAALERQLYEATTRNQLQQGQQGLQRGQLGAQRAEFERDSPGVRFNQAMRGNLAQNLQDVQLNVPDRVKGSLVTYSGGLRPSAIGEGGRAAGAQLAGLGSSMMGKDTFELPTMPELSQAPSAQGLALPKSNWLDKLLGVAGPAAGLIGAFGGRGQQQAPPPGIMDPRDALTDPNVWRGVRF